MNRAISFIVMLALVGSAVAANAQSPTGRSSDYWLKYAGKLPVGSLVRLRTSDGKRLTAVLAIVDETGITIEPRTRRPEPPRHIPFDQLEQLELKTTGMGTGKAVAVGAAAGAGTFLAILLILLSASWD